MSGSPTMMTKEESGNGYYPEPLHRGAPIQYVQAPPPRVYADPAPLGMLAYGTVFLCSSLVTLGAGGVTTPNIILVFAIFYGGIFQSLVGMWEIFLGNTFAATVFATYGGFNFTYGSLYLPQIGLASAYSVNGVVTEEFTHAIGIYLAIWCLITGLFCIGALRTTGPIVFTLGSTVIALACLSANCFHPNPHLNTAGGAMGLVATCGAYYGALSGFWSKDATFQVIRLPPVILASSV
ncbi:hypothetical protein JAAARDRAFT_210274 [Jaapia argillacea MUCL 33604]|uniref:Uncharacterized protein n=1 Tax=Jaapia argillacea MUCL 33604 TaxID=933084 RepID=A0A067PP27_9AGAM|nr:hypothetical protein JAAARDRAFT_210274 [Jaapia argillacea MUCL 33604]